MPPSSPLHSSSKQIRKNSSKACVNCRHRKKKCDGVTPTCGTCTTLQDECTWNSEKDRRKAVSRAEANALRMRVAELEQTLLERGAGIGTGSSSAGADASTLDLSPSPTPGPPSGGPSVVVEPPGGKERVNTVKGDIGVPMVPSHSSSSVSNSLHLDTRDEDNDDDLDRIIVQDHRGRLRVHHPSSAYRHDTTTEPTALTSPQAATVGHTHVSVSGEQYNRFLPDYYLTREQHDVAVDRFFRYFASWAQRATPHLFYRDMEVAIWTEHESDLPVVAPNYSPLLHNIILAIGLAFSDDEHLRALSTRRRFAAQGEKYLDRECSNPCVATVQALAIRSSFASTMGDYALGWVNHGLATRLCYALGLHVNTHSLVARGKLDPEIAAQRNVTFWSCFCQEGMWAIYIGRKPMMTDYSLPLPTTDLITDQMEWKWPPGPLESLPPQPSYLSLAFVETARLFEVAAEITRTIDVLDTWLAKLPLPLNVDSNSQDPVLPHILMIHLGWAWIVILLYQPFSQVVSRSRDGDPPQEQTFGTVAMTRCHLAATKIAQLCGLWRDQHSLRFTPPTLTAIIYSAGTSFLLAALQAGSPTQASNALDKVYACLDFLEQIGQTWQSGRQQAGILQDMVNECTRATFEIPALGDVNQGWTRSADKHAPTLDTQSTDTQQNPALQSGVHPMSWSADDGLDQFIATFLSQTTVPIAAQSDIFGLEGFL